MGEDADDAAADPLPTRVGPFDVDEVLGRGGMGIVYRATAPDGRPVAVKALRASLTDPEMRRRFEREAHIRLEHPNIVRVLDAGSEADGTPFIALELLDGETLASRLARGTLSAEQTVDVGAQACRGLAAAHAAGIVHRDLKPSNLFCSRDGAIRLLDFGVATLDSAETRLTRTGAVVGTLDYVSPEQAEGAARPDARSDVWSLGAVLYEALAGRPPFRQSTELATVVAILTTRVVPLRDFAPDVPPSLASVIECALARDPADRWPSADAFAQALQGADLAAPGEARPSSIPPGEQRVVAVLLARGVEDPSSVEQAVRGQRGMPVRLFGHRIVGVFGAETTSGDELQRAAAAAIRARPAAQRVAIGSGRATSTSGGIAGSALDAAERACQQAVAGVAMNTEAARGLTAAGELRPVGGELWELPVDRTMPAEILAEEHGPTVGRDAELAQLRRGLGEVLEGGTARVLLAIGPQGIGKSQLRTEVERFVQSGDEPAFVLHGRGEPLQAERHWSLWKSVLRWLSDRDVPIEQALDRLARRAFDDDAKAVTCTEALTPLFAPPSESTESTDRSHSDVQLIEDRVRAWLRDWLTAMCTRQPTVLLLEDLQWADARSLELLEDLVDTLRDRPLLVFATARPELLDTTPDLLVGCDAIRIDLRGLTRSEVAELVRTSTGNPLTESQIAAIAERTEGNPFFVRQIIRALEDGAPVDPSSDKLPLPLTVEAAVQSRLDQLPQREKDLCKRAAIFGRAFTPQELEGLGLSEAEPVLRSLVRRELLGRRGRTPAGAQRFDFRSTLFAEVAYRMVAQPLRTRLHFRAAELLQATPDGDPEEVGRHYERSGQLEIAATHYGLAALRATHEGDAETVLRCARDALRLDVHAEQRYALHMARADALRFFGRREDQAEELQRAFQYADLPDERARVLGEQCVSLSRSGRSTDALRKGSEAVRAARDANDPEALALALGRRFLALLGSGYLDDAQQTLGEAVAAAEDASPSVQALALEWQAQYASAVGDLGVRRDAFARLAEQHVELGDLRRAAGAESNLADVYNRLGDYERAATALRAARQRCRKVGHRAMEGYTLLNLGYSLAGLGRSEDAVEVLDEAATLAEGIGEVRLGLLVRVYRARALLPAGRHDESVAMAQRAADEAERAGMPAVRAGALTIVARAELARGRTDAAVASSADAMEIRDRLGGIEEDEAEVFVVRAEALRASRRNDEADEVRARGRQRLEAIAAGISDPQLRQQFIRDVPSHRALLDGTEG